MIQNPIAHLPPLTPTTRVSVTFLPIQPDTNTLASLGSSAKILSRRTSIATSLLFETSLNTASVGNVNKKDALQDTNAYTMITTEQIRTVCGSYTFDARIASRFEKCKKRMKNCPHDIPFAQVIVYDLQFCLKIDSDLRRGDSIRRMREHGVLGQNYVRFRLALIAELGVDLDEAMALIET